LRRDQREHRRKCGIRIKSGGIEMKCISCGFERRHASIAIPRIAAA
jgi:RNase P subunit RPR2